MGGAPPLPLGFAPQGAKNGHFWAIFGPFSGLPEGVPGEAQATEDAERAGPEGPSGRPRRPRGATLPGTLWGLPDTRRGS